MKTSNLLKATAIVLGILVSNCSSFRNTVTIHHTNFDEEVEQSQNLVFTFNKDLVRDSLLNTWDTTHYITFTPEVKGKFKWTGKNELTFSPMMPFAPSTDYKATVTPAITAKSKTKWSVDEKASVNFHTPYLKMQSTQVYWAMSDRMPGKVEVRMNVTFNYPVKPAEITKSMHVKVKGEEKPFQLISTDVSSTVSLVIEPVDEEKKDESIPGKVILTRGYRCPGSDWVSKEDNEVVSNIPPKTRLMVMEMLASFVDGEGVISILFNQPVVDENLKAMIKVNTTIGYTVESVQGGVMIKGDFAAGSSYNVIISNKLKGIFGTTLQEEHSQYVAFGQMLPALQFANDKSIYLTPAGAKNIALNMSGINKLKVTVIRIYENNLMFFMRSGQRYGSYYEERDESNDGDDYDYGYSYHSYNYYDYEEYGDKIGEKTVDAKSLARSGSSSLLHLDLEDMGYDNTLKGIYVIKLEDEERQWLQVSKFISFSDVGLIVKQGVNEVLVFANSIKTAEPIADAKIKFISTNNQIMATANTNSTGFVKLEDVKQYKPFNVGMITVRNGEDFNFILLDRTLVETSRFDVGGKVANAANYDCFIYGDRDIYRPGDTVQVNTVIRSFDWETVKDVPVKIKLLSPNGKEYKVVKGTLDAQGSAETAFALPTSVMTGLYTIEVYSGNDVLLNYSKISVEEFMPDRIKVTNTIDKKEAKANEKITASVKAVNLFGPPAANRNYQASMDLRRQYFSAPKYSNYNFNIHTGDDFYFNSIVRDGKTDDNGEATESFEIPTYADLGTLDGTILATVFDETGRPVNRAASFTVATQDVFYGIRYFDNWVATRQNLAIPVIALNKAGVSVGATATVQIVRYNWETVIERSGGSYNYNSQRRDEVLFQKEMQIPVGGTLFNYKPMYSGDYEVRIMRSGSTNYVSDEFWAYGWGDTQTNSFEVSNEGEVEITMDKQKYGVGDKADLLFNSPFEGKILVTVERDKVFEFYYLKTEKKAASLSLSIKEDYLPNVYITATAIRELKDNSMPLTVARGFVPLIVEKPANKIPIVITAPEKSRSKTRQVINIKAIPNAEVTVAVVDEGILQLKNYQTPDPYGYFYAKRALGVTDYDLYPYLFPELAYSKSSVGGDAENARRVNPVTAKRVHLVTLWSGVLKADGSGNVSFPVNIPSFSGALRVMAVAYKDKSFGSAEKVIKVADPVVISTALPRFLTPGDTITMPVTLSNTTDKSATVSSTVTLTGPIVMMGGASQSATLRPNAEQQVIFKFIAKKDIGQASVTVSVNGMNEKFSEKIDIAVRPASPLQKRTGGGAVNGGETAKLSLVADLLPSANGKLIISKSPLVQFGRNLSYLINYPYGCVEQTVSTAFPQIYFTDISKSIGTDRYGRSSYNPKYNVQAAIDKLESMQLYNGSLSYWQGGSTESWWGSAYGAHFLLESKKAGYDVSQGVLDKLYGYLQFKLKSKEVEDYWYYNSQNKLVSRSIAKHEIIYSMYVLALSGRYDYSAMNYYKAHEEDLSLDCKYMLACTFALAGNNINYLAVLPKIYAGENSVRSFGGSFYSGIRDEGLALNALLEADPDNPQIGVMARHLSQMLKDENWINTQEAAFSFLALGKIARKAAQSNATATVTVNGNTVATYSGGKDLVVNEGIYNQAVWIKTSGTGNLYYFWELEGVSAKGEYKEEDSYLKVRKSFYDRYGHPWKGNSFEQNDLVVVKINVESIDYDRSIENVAITDLLPAGFEIENPRVGSVPELNWITDNTSPDNMDIRDDRITFFSSVYDKGNNFYYVVRAVSKGKFVMGPVSADAMYNADYHSINGAGTIIVK